MTGAATIRNTVPHLEPQTERLELSAAGLASAVGLRIVKLFPGMFPGKALAIRLGF